MSYAFGLLKPDCVKRGLVQEVMNIITLAGLQVVASKRVRLTKGQCAIVWPVCTKQTYWEEMLEFSLSEDSVVFIVKGDNLTFPRKESIRLYVSFANIGSPPVSMMRSMRPSAKSLFNKNLTRLATFLSCIKDALALILL